VLNFQALALSSFFRHDCGGNISCRPHILQAGLFLKIYASIWLYFRIIYVITPLLAFLQIYYGYFLTFNCFIVTACPRIVSRAEWGARPPTSVTPMSNPVPWTVIHHGASASCYNQADCSAMVRSYQNQHMDVNGWNDIGYSFVAGEDGNIYEGRGWSAVGAHAPGYNSISIGICTIGTFTSKSAI
jgi:hypothetical protein